MLQELAKIYFQREELEGKAVSLYAGWSVFGDVSLTDLQAKYLEKASNDLGLKYKTIDLRPGLNILSNEVRIQATANSEMFLVIADRHFDFEGMLQRAEYLFLNDASFGRERQR